MDVKRVVMLCSRHAQSFERDWEVLCSDYQLVETSGQVSSWWHVQADREQQR